MTCRCLELGIRETSYASSAYSLIRREMADCEAVLNRY